MNDLETAIARTIDTYRSAVHGQEVEAFMRLYDPDVQVFDTWGVWSYEGAAAWRGPVTAWLTSLGSERVEVTFDDVKTTVAAGLAVVTAAVTYAAVSAGGERLRAMQNRLSWVLAVKDGGVRIVHEHTSAPIGDDMTAILNRR